MKSETIEVDAKTAAVLRDCAAQRGISVSDVVAELAPFALGPDDIADLDRAWAAAKAEGTIPHEEVERWLRTWGTPEFKPWSKR